MSTPFLAQGRVERSGVPRSWVLILILILILTGLTHRASSGAVSNAVSGELVVEKLRVAGAAVE